MEAFERTSCIDIDMEKVVSLQREGDMRVLRAVLTSNRLPACFNKATLGPRLLDPISFFKRKEIGTFFTIDRSRFFYPLPQRQNAVRSPNTRLLSYSMQVVLSI